MSERSELTKNLLAAAVLSVLAVVFWERGAKTIFIFLGTLGVLVAVHEWGHFIAAKAVNVHVYEFALGFGPKLITYMQRNGTDYTIRALPLGGFVNLKGMQPDDPITHDGLNGRRPAERALVYLAGPLMNIILAMLVFGLAGALVGTKDGSKPLVGGVVKRGPADKMGLQLGDRLLAINGRPITREDDIYLALNPHPGEPITVEVERNGQTLRREGTLSRREIKGPLLTVIEAPAGGTLPLQAGDQPVFVDGRVIEPQTPAELSRMLAERAGKPVSVVASRRPGEWVTVDGVAGPVKSEVKPGTRVIGRMEMSPVGGPGPRIGLTRSLEQGAREFLGFFASFYGMFQRGQVAENVGGPVSIFGILGLVSRLPPAYYTDVLGQLSLSLAVFNLIPIPVLDGGHMFLLLWEVLRRRRLEPEMQKIAAMCGLAIIGVIFVLIMFKDIRGLFPG